MELNNNNDGMLKRKGDMEILARIDERLKLLIRKVNEIDEKIKDYREVRTDVMWLKRFFWILATGVVGGLLTSSFVLLGR